MDTIGIITVIVLLLIAGVVTSVYFQYHEQQKAEKRQKIAQFRFRARDGLELYERFIDQPIGKHSRKIILQYAHHNLNQALLVDPSQSDVQSSLQSIKDKLVNLEGENRTEAINIPSDPQELMVQMNRFRKLMRYIHKLAKLPGIDMNSAHLALAHIKQMYFILQLYSYLAVVKEKLKGNNLLLAIQYMDNAKNQLIKHDQSDPHIRNLVNEFQSIEETINQRQNQNMLEYPTDDLEESEEESYDLGDSDDLFQPKKKW